MKIKQPNECVCSTCIGQYDAPNGEYGGMRCICPCHRAERRPIQPLSIEAYVDLTRIGIWPDGKEAKQEIIDYYLRYHMFNMSVEEKVKHIKELITLSGINDEKDILDTKFTGLTTVPLSEFFDKCNCKCGKLMTLEITWEDDQGTDVTYNLFHCESCGMLLKIFVTDNYRMDWIEAI